MRKSKRPAKRKLEVGDQIEEFGVWRAKDEPGVRVRQGYRKAEVLAVIDEPAEYGVERVALIRYFDGDNIVDWTALPDVSWQSELWRFEPEFEKREHEPVAPGQRWKHASGSICAVVRRNDGPDVEECRNAWVMQNEKGGGESLMFDSERQTRKWYRVS